MKLKIFSLLTFLAIAIGLTSCHDDPNVKPVGPSAETGSVNLLSMGIEISNAEKVIETTAGKKKSRASVDLSNFIIEITKLDGTKVQEWTYSEMPEVFELPVGEYVATVYSHHLTKAAWDAPYFVGERAFKIENEKITDIGLVKCVLSNIKVSIRFTDKLRKYLGDDVVVTVIANDEGRLEFTKNETRSGYFEAIDGSSTLIVEFNGTVNGNHESFRRSFSDAEAGQHRIITFDALIGIPDDDETGTIKPGDGLSIDLSVYDEDLTANVTFEEDIIHDGTYPGGEDPGPGPGPDDPVSTIKITCQEPLDFNKANSVDVESAVVYVDAPKGITHFLVSIMSDNDNFIGSAGEFLPLQFDLCYPPEDAVETLSRLFPVGDAVIGSTHLDFDISSMVPLLAAFPGTHKFQISVQDSENMQEIRTLTFFVP